MSTSRPLKSTPIPLRRALYVVPKTWEWYGDAIKWFVAVAAALLAFGFD
jgi:hypothetical protein